MPELVRVKAKKSGHEFTVAAVRLEDETFAAGVKVLDKPAARADGTPLPAKPNVRAAARARAADTGDQEGRGPESKEEQQ